MSVTDRAIKQKLCQGLRQYAGATNEVVLQSAVIIRMSNLVTGRLGETTRTTFDAANRAILTEYLADNTSQSATYDQYGDKVAISNADVTYSYTNDNQHRLTGKTDSRNNQSLLWARKLPRQVDNPKVEDLAFANASAGVTPPRLSWSRSSLYSR